MSKDNHTTQDIELTDEFIPYCLTEETVGYLRRGRRHASLALSDVNNGWISAIRAWHMHLQEGHAAKSRDSDDFAAELRLRELDPPYASVKNELGLMRAAAIKLGPNAAETKRFKRQMAGFLEQRAKLKN